MNKFSLVNINKLEENQSTEPVRSKKGRGLFASFYSFILNFNNFNKIINLKVCLWRICSWSIRKPQNKISSRPESLVDKFFKKLISLTYGKKFVTHKEK